MTSLLTDITMKKTRLATLAQIKHINGLLAKLKGYGFEEWKQTISSGLTYAEAFALDNILKTAVDLNVNYDALELDFDTEKTMRYEIDFKAEDLKKRIKARKTLTVAC